MYFAVYYISYGIFFWLQISSKLLFKKDLIQTLQVENDAPFFEVHNSYHYGWVQTNLFVSNDRVS